MKRAIGAGVGIVVLLGAIGGLAGSSAASGSGQTVITLIGHQKSVHVVDNGRKGDSAGDMGVLAGTLSEHGKHVGRYQGYCVQIDGNGHSQCTFTLALPAGQVVIETGYGAGVNGNKTTHEPIVGGTGTYSTARGFAVGQETGRTTIKEVLHLQS